MKKHLKAGLLIILIVCAFSACNKKNDENTSKSTTKETITLNYVVFFPANHVQAKTAEAWTKEIEKRTEGKIVVNTYLGGTLSSANQIYEAVESGVADVGMSAFAYTKGRFPLLEGLDLPHGYPDGKTATIIANKIAKKYNPKELSGVHLLYLHAHGPGILASKGKIQNINDIKKYNIRGTGLSANIIEALGANPISMSQGDTYEALQKGVVDATFCPLETLKGWNQGEAIEYVIDTKSIGYTTTMFCVMNNKVWETIPDNLKPIINEINDEWIIKHGEAWDKADKEGQAFVEDLGKTFVELSDSVNKELVDSMKPIFSDYISNTKKQELPGEALIDDVRELLK